MAKRVGKTKLYRNKTKAWRKEECPRYDDGRKRKGLNREDKNQTLSARRLPVGLHPFTWALFKRAGIFMGA